MTLKMLVNDIDDLAAVQRPNVLYKYIMYTNKKAKIFRATLLQPPSWPLEWPKVKSKYANGKRTYDFMFDGNSNVCPVYHNFRDVQHVHDLDNC